MSRRLLLLRHGRTAWNDQGRAQGHADTRLDALGLEQAHAAAAFVARLGVAAIWTSDLARARETAEIIGTAARVAVKPDDRLREYDVGERQGLTIAQTAQCFPAVGDDWELGNPPLGIPGSETYAEVASRIVPACREAMAALGPGETGLVVSHGACLKVAVGGVLGWPPEHARTLVGLQNCHLGIVEEGTPGGARRLVGWGLPPISHP